MLSRSISTNTAWNTAGQGTLLACHWARVLLLMHCGDLALLGRFALAAAIVGPITTVAAMGTRTALVTDANSRFRLSDYVALRLITATAAMLCMGVVAWICRHDADLARLIIFVGAGEVVFLLSDILHGVLHRQERFDRTAIAVIVRSIVSVLLLGGLLILFDAVGINPTWAVIALPAGKLLVLVLYDVPIAYRASTQDRQVSPPATGQMFSYRVDGSPNRPLSRQQRAGGRAGTAGQASSGTRRIHWQDASGTRLGGLWPRFDGVTLGRLAWLVAPLGAAHVVASLTMAMPRYLVSHHLSVEALGVFIAIGYLALPVRKLAASLMQTTAPGLAHLFAGRQWEQFSRLLVRLVLLTASAGMLMFLGAWLVGDRVLVLIYGPSFLDHRTLMLTLVAASAVGLIRAPLATALQAMRQFRGHMAINGLRLAILLGAAVVLVPSWGLVGMATAMAVEAGSGALATAAAIAWTLHRGRTSSSDAPQAPPAFSPRLPILQPVPVTQTRHASQR
jgi:O-antigen/teichoic acid export membrane protein